MKIAAVLMNAEFANVAANLKHCELLIQQASLQSAELILLPEFFTSAIGFSEPMLDAALQGANVHHWMVRQAADFRIIVGGSYMTYENGNAYHVFELVFPDHSTYRHKKDIPTQIENCYYIAGDTAHLLRTPIGTFGVALCWEMIRYDTLRHITGAADIILSSSCWWDLPDNSPVEREPLRRYNQALAREAPAELARLAGIPTIHAAHCGKAAGYHFPAADKMQSRHFVGSAQIIDQYGRRLEERSFSEGEGLVYGDINWDPSAKKLAKAFPEKVWIPDLPESYLQAWETINPQGKHYYETVALPYYKSKI